MAAALIKADDGLAVQQRDGLGGFVAVMPGRFHANDLRHLDVKPADTRKRVPHMLALHLKLLFVAHMLGAAAAATRIIRAGRRLPPLARGYDLQKLAKGMRFLRFDDQGLDLLTGQGAGDKNNLALMPAYTFGFAAEGVYGQGQHLIFLQGTSPCS